MFEGRFFFDNNSIVKKLDNENIVKYFDNKFIVKIFQQNKMIKPIKNLVGQTADKDNFFERPRETKKLWDALASGEHILFVAPRRSGKTSLLYFLQDNPQEGKTLIFLEVESVSSVEDFFSRLSNVLLLDDELSSRGMRLGEKGRTFLQRIRSIGGDVVGKIELAAGEKTHPHKAFERLLGQIAKNIPDGEQLVIMIDEFAQAVQNIAEQSSDDARMLLLAHRELRQNRAISAKVQFLYCGSIGLEYVAERLGASNAINDIRTSHLQPLRKEEAESMIRSIVAHPAYSLAENEFTDENIAQILQQVRWWVPYYLQILLAELQTYWTDNELLSLSSDIITLAYKQVLSNRQYFVWWEIRLNKAFKGDERSFVMDVLNTAATKDTIDAAEISNLAQKFTVEQYKSIIAALTHDGYIVQIEGKTGFGVSHRFVSPMLQDWWRENVAH